MHKHFALAAFALAMAASIVPASAQGRNPNDGGLVTVQPGASTPPTTTITNPPHYGRPANDGGTTEVQGGDKALYNSAPASQPSTPPHLGRPLNDGGM